MTKEMCPSHRIDVLSYALAHYGWKKKRKLGNGPHHRCSQMWVLCFVLHMQEEYCVSVSKEHTKVLLLLVKLLNRCYLLFLVKMCCVHAQLHFIC